MECPHCRTEMDPTPPSGEFNDCNTWTCPGCGHVVPEMGSWMGDEEDEDHYRDYEF